METAQENHVDSDPATQGNAPAWRDAVCAAAQEAALALDKARWDKHGCTAFSFAYRWEHVQAVVRLANRLAERTGADREIVEAAVIRDADKLTWLGATSVLHIASSVGGMGKATTGQLLDRLSGVAW